MRLLLIAALLAACSAEDPGGFGRAERGPEAEDPDDPDDPPPQLSHALELVDGTADAGLDVAPGYWPAHEMTHPEHVAGGGAVLSDLDGDGVTDLLLTSPFAPNRLHLGLGDGTFEPVQNSGLEDIPGVRAVSAADLDGDGLRELFLFDGPRVLLLKNLGSGSFDEPRILLETQNPWLYLGGALADGNGDGEVDVYVSAYGMIDGPEDLHIQGQDRLLLGRGDLEFQDGSALLGSDTELAGETLVSAWMDCDGDGLLDLYSVKDFGTVSLPNQLFRGDGEGWTERGSKFGLDVGIFGMGVAAADVDLDGSIDIVLSNTHGSLPAFSIQDGIAVERTASWDLASPDPDRSLHGWGLELADLDNDRDLDLLTAWGYKERGEAEFVGIPQVNSVHRWVGDGFEHADDAMPAAEGLAWRSPLVADLNADGALDVVWVGVVDEPQVLLGVPNGNGWLEVKLDGPPGNRDGLGARVCVPTAGQELCERIGVGSRGLYSAREPIAHIGLGLGDVERVRVQWPDGSVTEEAGVARNQRITVTF